MNKRFLPAVLLAGLLVAVATASPALAGSDDASVEARAAASLDELRATDAELVKAIGALDEQIARQQTALQASQQALEAADKSLKDRDDALVAMSGELDRLKTIANERAVEEYMRPHDGSFDQLLAAEGLADASRRGEFLQEVTRRDREALSTLKALQSQLKRAREEALDARKLADERRADEQRKLDELNVTRADKARLEVSLKNRIAAYAAEDDASSKPRKGTSGTSGRASRSGTAPADDTVRISAAGLQWPLAGRPVVNSPYGARWGKLHAGIDIQASRDTPVLAAKAGKVTFAGWESGYGNYTCIDHGGNFTTCYGHQSRLLVKAGEVVGQGQQIGVAGDSGTSYGVHIHFETCVNGVPECFFGSYRNPMDYLPSIG